MPKQLWLKQPRTLRLKSEAGNAFQNAPSSITTEVELICPDSPPSNSKAPVTKPNFVQVSAPPVFFAHCKKQA